MLWLQKSLTIFVCDNPGNVLSYAGRTHFIMKGEDMKWL